MYAKEIGNCKVSRRHNSIKRALSAVAMVNSEMTLSYHLTVRTLTAHSESGCAGSKLFVLLNLSASPSASGFQAENWVRWLFYSVCVLSVLQHLSLSLCQCGNRSFSLRAYMLDFVCKWSVCVCV